MGKVINSWNISTIPKIYKYINYKALIALRIMLFIVQNLIIYFIKCKYVPGIAY